MRISGQARIRPSSAWPIAVIPFSLLSWATSSAAQTAGTAVVARWGQSSALLSSLFLVHGGKTEGTAGGGYTYTSGPNTADLLALDLSQSFPAGVGSSAPWQTLTTAATSQDSNATDSDSPANAPAVAFAALSPVSSNQLVLFGGDGSPVVPIQTRNDSMYLLELSPTGTTPAYTASWRTAGTSWNQPMRRIYASSESSDQGRYFLIGGEKADGSGMALAETWDLDVSDGSATFKSEPAPISGLIGQTSTLLSDGSLLQLGGADATGLLQSFQTVTTYDTKRNVWKTINTTAAGNAGFPPARRGHIAVSLPSQKVFIHGGASDSAMTSALGDAWILDWSQDTPRWSKVDLPTGAPSARFGHAAVAYGGKIVMTLGWTGSNPADTGVYVFDATGLKISSNGNVHGGGWSPTYTPDPQVGASKPISSGSSNGGGSSTSNPNGNGSSTSSGGDGGTSGQTGGSDSGPTFGGGDGSSSGGNTSGGGNGGDSGGDDHGGTSGAAKAGAVIGAFVGVGLAVAGAYAAYHKYEQKRLNNWRHGDGSHALLGVVDMDQGGGYGSEKLAGQYAAGTRPSGPREYGAPAAMAALPRQGYRETQDSVAVNMANLGPAQREANVVPIWSPNAAGHAIEGPGPRIRDRLAMLTGLAAWAPQSQPRFDMLADEDEDDEFALGATRRRTGRDIHSADTHADDEDDGDDAYLSQPHVREHSYGKVGHHDPDDYLQPEYDDAASSDFERRSSAEHGYYTSPFEDTSPSRPSGPRSYESRPGTGGGFLSAAGAALGMTAPSTAWPRSDGGHSSDSARDAPSGASDQTHRSRAQSSLRSGAQDSGMDDASIPTADRSSRSNSTRSGAMVSFSDTPYKEDGRTNTFGRNGGSSMMPLDGPRISDSTGSMRRSPTWWGRIMGNAFVERSASGRFIGMPGAHEPIRDPAPPPAFSLSVIKESPRSVEPSEDNPFADVVRMQDSTSTDSSLARRATVGVRGMGAYDELGRKRRRSGQWEELDDGHGHGGLVMASAHHGRSQSSLQSARTNASSHLEAQLRGMDVVQRTRTGSSRHTASTRRTGSQNTSEPGSFSSRMGSLYEQGVPERVEEEETPGQIIWGPQDWKHQTVQSPPSAGARLYPMAEDAAVQDESLDIVDGLVRDSHSVANDSQEQGEQSFEYAQAVASPAQMVVSPFDDSNALRRTDSYHEPFESTAPESYALRALRGSAIPREPSEVPSITPATTKRARQNPLLTAAVSPQPKRSREPPLTGTVKDRVREIERKRSAEPEHPPPSPEILHSSASPTKSGIAEGSSAKQRRAIEPLETSAIALGHGMPTSGSTETERERERDLMSPIRIVSPPSARGEGGGDAHKEGQKKVQHGLVPKAQIVIANPDDGH